MTIKRLTLKGLVVPGILSLCLLQLALPGAFASEREANGWIVNSLEDAGTKLTYPATWKKTAEGSQPADLDNVLKVSGSLASGGWAELSLLKQQGDVSPSLFFKILEESMWTKLPDFKAGPERSVKLTSGQSALQKEITFKHDGTPFSQRYLATKVGSKSFTLILTCPLSDYQNAGAVWTTAINSLAPVVISSAPGLVKTSTSSRSASDGASRSATSSSTSSSTSSAASSRADNSGVIWHSKDTVLSLTYPDSLKVESRPDEDHLLNVNSNQGGKLVGLDVYRGEAVSHLSLAEHSAILEEKYFQTQKDYRKIGEDPVSIGSGGSVPAIVRESTFETSGTKVHHLSGFVMAEKYLYAICLTTSGINSNEAHKIWSNIASSISVKR